MSHIHLPDGVLPPVWWIAGFAVCFILLGFAVRRVQGNEVRRKIPFVGVVAALMLIFMSVPLGIIPVHLSLAVLCGIMAGPALGFMAVFVVNIILAMMGHGGITTVGINTLILGSEVVTGYYLFAFLSRHFSLTASSVAATVVALLVSTTLMAGFLITTVGAEAALPIEHYHTHAGDSLPDTSHGYIDDGAGEDLHEALSSVNYLSFTGWTAVGLIIVAGIFIESLITGLIINFFSKVRPDLISRAA